MNKSLLDKLEFFLLCGIVFTLPLHKRVIPWMIAVFCLVFLINGGIKRIARNINNRYILVTTIFYALLLIGVFYSSERQAAWFDMEVKFSLFLFPILFSGIKLTHKQFSEIFLWFILGCLFATMVCLVTAILLYANSSDASVFYYQSLSVFQHPSYFSMYLNFCIYFIYYYMVFNKEYYRIKSDFISVSIIVIFSLFVVLLSSKIGLITLFLVIFTGTLLWFLKSRAVFPSIMVFAMLSTMIYFSFKYSNQIQGRLKEAVNTIADEKVRLTTTGARLAIWKSSWELVKEKPVFGYGTGDVRSELMRIYERDKYESLIKLKYNAHNQYFQIFIAIGGIGLISLMLYLLFPAFDKRFMTNSVYIGFLVLILVNFLPESMLETQAGVVYYAFFNSLLYFNLDKIVPLKMKEK